jgi:hypothetical protein
MRASWELSGWTVSFEWGKPASKRAAFVELQSPRFIARATLWESLELDCEAIHVETERTIFEHCDSTDFTEVVDVVNRFFASLK